LLSEGTRQLASVQRQVGVDDAETARFLYNAGEADDEIGENAVWERAPMATTAEEQAAPWLGRRSFASWQEEFDHRGYLIFERVLPKDRVAADRLFDPSALHGARRRLASETLAADDTGDLIDEWRGICAYLR
jgi:hypothetical protein